MSAFHTFVSSARLGVGAALEASPGGPSPALTVTLGDPAAGGPVPVALAAAGPGDVLGLDSRAITRTWPRDGVFDGEPNFMACIEFAEYDLPWRYSPPSPSLPSSSRLGANAR